MVDRPLTFMAVHAHPDDEASSTGGVFARLAAEGVRTVLVTCTDGRCGDGPGGVKPGEPGHDPDAVVATRLRELEESCAILKVSNLELLGYADSGMVGWPTNDAPGSFWSTPVAVAAVRLAELIRQYEPDVVVTYDEYGFYGHPDHIQAHRVTMAALELTSSVAKTYWVTIPHSTMRKFEVLFNENGADIEPDRAPDGTEVAIGLPDDEVTTWVDVAPYVRAKFDALAAHASQVDNEFFLKAGLDSFSAVFGVETFSRVHDNTDAALPEDDLFAGLR